MQILKKLFNKNKKLNKDNIPKHIAIIMDGNGRWAAKRALPRTAGHKEGAENLKNIVEECAELGVKYLTVYAFSTENWNRPQKEIDYLMELLKDYLREFSEDERNKDVKLNVIGNIKELSEDIQNEIIRVQDDTKNDFKIQLNLAVNYGGRNEIHTAVEKIISDVNDGNIDANTIEVNDEFFSGYLYTKDIPDPELVIRTSGELRLSNFLSYQCVYSELAFPKVYWPDFKKEHLIEVIYSYQNRKRRFGGV